MAFGESMGELQPVAHRKPLPEVLSRGMVALAINWGWKWQVVRCLEWKEGVARIGKVLRAHRLDLVLPRDMFDGEAPCLFLRISKLKALRRGKGRVQHIKVETADVALAVQNIFGELAEFLPLFPLSPSAFRTRWEKLLNSLGVPKDLRPTPASVRGGGAIMAYGRSEPIDNILWRIHEIGFPINT